MASARYPQVAWLRPAMEMRPSSVMYTCHLAVMCSTWGCASRRHAAAQQEGLIAKAAND
jgi:hypothetical protein